MTARRLSVLLTPQEVLVVAFYRAIGLERQLDVDGLLGRYWRDPDVARRFSVEARLLGAGHEGKGAAMPALLASDVRPFLDASEQVVGVQRRAA